jgi:hypothetical protein
VVAAVAGDGGRADDRASAAKKVPGPTYVMVGETVNVIVPLALAPPESDAVTEAAGTVSPMCIDVLSVARLRVREG